MDASPRAEALGGKGIGRDWEGLGGTGVRTYALAVQGRHVLSLQLEHS